MHREGYPCLPVPEGQENYYLGLPTSGVESKRVYNPALRLATATEQANSPEKCFTWTYTTGRAGTIGNAPDNQKYIYDFRFYLNRFRFADPDIVFLEPGTNNAIHFGVPADAADITTSLGIMVPSILAACPSAKIIIASSMPKSRSKDGDAKWPDTVAIDQIYKTFIAGLSTASKDRVKLWSAGPFVSAEGSGFGLSTGTTDAYGFTTRGADDYVHFMGPATEAFGKAMFAAAACVKLGV